MPTRLELPTEHPDVQLKGLILGDARSLFEAIDANRPHLSQFGNTIAEAYPTQRQVDMSLVFPGDPNRLRMGIWSTGTLVGGIDLYPPEEALNSAEIGYWLDSRHTGKGYATLAAKAMADHGLEHYPSVHAEVMKGNDASTRVLERAGFQQASEDTDTVIYKRYS